MACLRSIKVVFYDKLAALNTLHSEKMLLIVTAIVLLQRVQELGFLLIVVIFVAR